MKIKNLKMWIVWCQRDQEEPLPLSIFSSRHDALHWTEDYKKAYLQGVNQGIILSTKVTWLITKEGNPAFKIMEATDRLLRPITKSYFAEKDQAERALKKCQEKFRNKFFYIAEHHLDYKNYEMPADEEIERILNIAKEQDDDF